MGLNAETKGNILKAMFGKANTISIATTCFIGIGRVDGTTFAEPADTTGYARASLGYYQDSSGQKMGAPENGTIKNTSPIFLPEATSSWGEITHFGLFTSATAAQPFFYGELTSSVTISPGYVPIFRTNSLSVTIN